MGPARDRLLAMRARLRAHRHWRWLVLLVVSGGMMLSVVNVTIVNVAVPRMAEDLGADVASVGWVVTGFLATQATLLSIAGRAGDLYGRRRVFLFGIAVLVAGSMLCAVAWSAESLVSFRVVQGVGASVMAPTAFATVADLFAPTERGAAMGFVVSVISAAPTAALALGGLLVSVAGWRSVFWFTPAIGIFVLVGAALLMPASRPTSKDLRFDVAGAGLLGLGLLSVLMALAQGRDWGWLSPGILGLLALSIVALSAFVAHERRTPEPMVDLDLFRLRSLTTANVASFAGSGALFGLLFVLPFYLTAALGMGPVQLALAVMPVAVAYLLVSPFAGRAVNPLGPARLASTGYVIAAAGALVLAWAAPADRYLLLMPGIVFVGVGLALATAPLTVTAISEVPAARMGVAASFPNISRYTGGALGAAALGAVLGGAAPGAFGGETATAEAVSEGFRQAALVAIVFLVGAFLAARLMPARLPLGPRPAP